MRGAGNARFPNVVPTLRIVLLSTVLTLVGCETTGVARPTATSGDATGSVSQPIALKPTPPVVSAPLPPEMSSPINAPSDTALPPEGDVMTAGDVLGRLRARLSTPTCIVGPNNTRWRNRYAGYPQRFADQVQAILPLMLVVMDELERRKLPGEFALIPIVESWYRPDARGFGGPAGMWQMIAQTARNNGVTVIRGYDGRLSPIEATRAALTYLDKLQAIFGDWRLTAMGYNSGEYRVMNEMPDDELQGRKAGGLFHYRRPHGLSFTTYEYVAKLRALTCLLAHPELRSIPLVESTPVVHWVPYDVPAGISSLDTLAQQLQTDPAKLKFYNQGYAGGRIVAGAPRTVLVPASTRPRWDQATTTATEQPEPEPLAQDIAPEPEADPAVVKVTKGKPAARTHRVAKGETLGSIARKYGVSVQSLQKANHLGSKAALKVGQTLKLGR